MSNFIYIFDEHTKDALLDMGFELLKRDDKSHIYVFVNENRENFSLANRDYVLSDTLTF